MIIDWLTFTQPCPVLGENPTYLQMRGHAEKAIAQLNDHCPLFSTIKQQWIETSNVPPYAVSYRDASTGIVIRLHPERKDYLVSLTGEACKVARDGGYLREMLELGGARASRVDIAYDVPTDVRPNEVFDAGFTARCRTHSKLQSPRGETVYLFSRTSERFIRLYRYDPPHPRSHLLRFEAELKGRTAKRAVAEILVNGVDAVGMGVFQGVQFQHPQAEKWFTGKAVTFKTEPYRRNLGKTERWLIVQAAPAFNKLVAEGVIDDPLGWLQQYFLGGRKNG